MFWYAVDKQSLAEFSVGEAHQAAAITAGPAYGSHLRGAGGQLGARWGGGGGRGLGEWRDARCQPKQSIMRTPELQPYWRPRTPLRLLPPQLRKPAPTRRACAVSVLPVCAARPPSPAGCLVVG
ncbi:hypothetical protein H8959_010912 [Pygathrix nigripes]